MKNKFSLTLLLLLTTAGRIFPQTSDAFISRPKLVVGIVVDQMRYDYLPRYWNKFGDKGFKRLVNEGFLFRNAHYNYMPTFTGPGHASVYTGTTPSVHGIAANAWYERTSGKTVYCVDDSKYLPVGAEAKPKSPSRMLTSTVTDELKLATNFNSKIIGVALKDRSSILPAGHTADAAYWFDDPSGNFISSTFYMDELPQWVMNFNSKKLREKYLSQPWNTLLPVSEYTESTPDSTAYEELYAPGTKPVFPYDLPALRLKAADLLAATPFGNSITKDFAIEAIKNEMMGADLVTDFLAVSFSSTDIVGHRFGPNSIEMEDTYLRLDKDLAELLGFIEGTIGLNNTLIFLTADHGALLNPKFLSDHKIPAGNFSIKTYSDSLEKYLDASLHNSNWISFADNDQVYLNDSAMKNQVKETIRMNCAEFLLTLPRVARVYTSGQMQSGEFTDPIVRKIQNGFHVKRSGDLFVLFEPAYMDWGERGTSHGSPYSYDTHVPIIFFGKKIPKGSSAEEVYITGIAPTLSALLNISFPNGCTGKVFKQIVK